MSTCDASPGTMAFHACLSAFILGTMFHYLMRKDPAEEALQLLQHEVTVSLCIRGHVYVAFPDDLWHMV